MTRRSASVGLVLVTFNPHDAVTAVVKNWGVDNLYGSFGRNDALLHTAPGPIRNSFVTISSAYKDVAVAGRNYLLESSRRVSSLASWPFVIGIRCHVIPEFVTLPSAPQNAVSRELKLSLARANILAKTYNSIYSIEFSACLGAKFTLFADTLAHVGKYQYML
jgi:hypothetical protein